MQGDWRSEAHRWFQQASLDLKAVRWNIEGGFYDTASFLSQQASEKALKSLLYHLGMRKRALLTHSIVERIQEASPSVSSLSLLLDSARDLDLHYIPSRDPSGLPSGYPHKFYSTDVADRAYVAAERILLCVREYFEATQTWEVLGEEEM